VLILLVEMTVVLYSFVSSHCSVHFRLPWELHSLVSGYWLAPLKNRQSADGRSTEGPCGRLDEASEQ
jgi:hypothetical protein